MYELSTGVKNSQVKSHVVGVTQLPNYVWLFCDPMDCNLPGSSVHGILQARILEWVAMSFSRGSSQPRDWIHVFYIAGGFFTTEPPGKPKRVLELTNHRTTTSILYILSKKIKHFHTNTLKVIYSFLFVHWKTNLLRLGLPRWSRG